MAKIWFVQAGGHRWVEGNLPLAKIAGHLDLLNRSLFPPKLQDKDQPEGDSAIASYSNPRKAFAQVEEDESTGKVRVGYYPIDLTVAEVRKLLESAP